jgi:hypothetical protein
MRKQLTKFTAPLAAGLTALAVTVTVPALGNGNPGTKEEGSGPTAQNLRTCLTEHGQDVSATDDYGLKRWIVEHQADPAARDALEACDVYFGDKKPGDGAATAPCVKPASGSDDGAKDKVRAARRSRAEDDLRPAE